MCANADQFIFRLFCVLRKNHPMYPMLVLLGLAALLGKSGILCCPPPGRQGHVPWGQEAGDIDAPPHPLLQNLSAAIKLCQKREILGPLVSLAEGGVASEGRVGTGCRADLTSSLSQGVIEASPVRLPHPTARPLWGVASPWVLLAVAEGFYCLSLSMLPLQVPLKVTQIAMAA